ncbi:hypothetical protein J6590_019655 [Homalodisca vitripennis]|nr:hypothetical protein J6590_019655 [Homalodisca vitripennis]
MILASERYRPLMPFASRSQEGNVQGAVTGSHYLRETAAPRAADLWMGLHLYRMITPEVEEPCRLAARRGGAQRPQAYPRLPRQSQSTDETTRRRRDGSPVDPSATRTFRRSSPIKHSGGREQIYTGSFALLRLHPRRVALRLRWPHFMWTAGVSCCHCACVECACGDNQNKCFRSVPLASF